MTRIRNVGSTGLALTLLAACAVGCVTSRPILVLPLDTGEAPPVVFANVRVFDGESDALSAPVDVVVSKGRIASIAPAGGAASPAGATRIDGTGRTLLPGLIDCHAHVGGGDGAPPWTARLPNDKAQAAALLYSGVTTVLNPGRDADLVAMAREIDAGKQAGPHFFRGSRYFTAMDGHPVPLAKAIFPWPFSRFFISEHMIQASSADQASRAVDAELDADSPDFVKVMYDALPIGSPHLTKELLSAIVGEVNRRGQRAIVHISSPDDVLDSIDAGASILMHVPWDGELTDVQVQRIVASGIPLVTTRRLYAVMAAGLAGTLQFDALEREVMPTGAADAFGAPPAGYQPPGFSPEYIAAFPRYDATLGKNIAKLHAAGAKLLAGTDSGLPGIFHGAALHRELQSLVALGIPSAAVLRMATSVPAKVLDPKADFGRIAPGMRADLLLVAGDPIADISATEHIVGVWQGGRPLVRGAAQ